ncbi:MAG: ABC-F family ATP-binding cassette domain-containing protein [Phototrophicaceae bacterium]
MGEVYILRQRMTTLEAQLQSVQDAALLADYIATQDRFINKGGYELDYRLAQIMVGLGIAHLDPARTMSSLSGGEKIRVALGALLLREPDLLILDEPTNHLDENTLRWLENYLQAYPRALVMVSHDRGFIDRTATVIVELNAINHQITAYHGDYQAYLAARQAAYDKQLASFDERQQEIKRLERNIKAKTYAKKAHGESTDNDKLVFNYKGGRVEQQDSRNIQNARRRLALLEDDPLKHPGREWMTAFIFDPLPCASDVYLSVSGLTSRYGERTLFSDLTQSVLRGQRVVIVGENGAGKSTLLRIMAGRQSPDRGTVQTAPGVRVGYLDQEQETLDPQAAVLADYATVASGTLQEQIAQLHRSGLFAGDLNSNTRFGELSVGQQRKVQLAKIIAQRANLLILDEPTNHLAPDTLEGLEAALINFQGALVAASHDRWFIDHVATQVWRLTPDGIHVEIR